MRQGPGGWPARCPNGWSRPEAQDRSRAMQGPSAGIVGSMRNSVGQHAVSVVIQPAQSARITFCNSSSQDRLVAALYRVASRRVAATQPGKPHATSGQDVFAILGFITPWLVVNTIPGPKTIDEPGLKLGGQGVGEAAVTQGWRRRSIQPRGTDGRYGTNLRHISRKYHHFLARPDPGRDGRMNQARRDGEEFIGRLKAHREAAAGGRCVSPARLPSCDLIQPEGESRRA